VGGYTSTVVPDDATIIRVKSTGTCTTYDDYTLASQTPTPTPTAVAQTPTPTPTAVAQTPTPTPTTDIGQCYVYLVQSTVTQSSYGVRYTPPEQGSRDENFSMMLNISGTDVSEFRICSTVEPTLLDYTQGSPTGIGQVDGITRTGPNGSCSSILDCSGASQTPTPTPTAPEFIPATYDCINGNCIEAEGSGGTYSSLSACQADCVDPCFIEGTNITLADGSQVLIETLQVGDILKSFAIDTLPLYSDDNTVLTTWSTENLTGTLSTATIMSITPVQVSEIVVINDLLKTTPDHRHLVKHDGVWSFVMASKVVVGDIMVDINNNEVEVTSVETQEVEKTVYKMDVETLDVFYAENILTHNIKPSGDTWDCTPQGCVAAVDGDYATLADCQNAPCIQGPTP
jgi:hypothetical protein